MICVNFSACPDCGTVLFYILGFDKLRGTYSGGVCGIPNNDKVNVNDNKLYFFHFNLMDNFSHQNKY